LIFVICDINIFCFFGIYRFSRNFNKLSGRKNNEQEGDSEIHDSKKCVCTSYKKTDETDAPEASSMGATGSLTWENRATGSQDLGQSRPNSVWGHTDLHT
jgi:hypothetical protein